MILYNLPVLPTRPGSSFLTTRWSVLAAAANPDPVLSRPALETLCASTWYPLYAFVRRRGHDAEDARDLVQGFFARFLEKADLGSLDPARGRFRSYLLASMLNWLSDEHGRASARKRGGGVAPISIDFDVADERYRVDPGHDLTPERLFERQWALALLDLSLARVEREYAATGKKELFEALKPALQGRSRDVPLSEIAARLGITEGAVKVAAHRIRHRFRDALRSEIAETVTTVEEIEEEIQDLFRALEIPPEA
ncbi:MAG: RNA polymerase sigma factor [Planctomycetota bacterium]